MSTFSLFWLAAGLAMDAAAVCAFDGIAYPKAPRALLVVISFVFGTFQGAMPALGLWAGQALAALFQRAGLWLAFFLLSALGLDMVREGLQKEGGGQGALKKLSLWLILSQGVSTSIDALLVGVSFSSLQINAAHACFTIAGVTFLCCLFAAFLGRRFGELLGRRAQVTGGAILVLLAVKLLLKQLFQ